MAYFYDIVNIVPRKTKIDKYKTPVSYLHFLTYACWFTNQYIWSLRLGVRSMCIASTASKTLSLNWDAEFTSILILKSLGGRLFKNAYVWLATKSGNFTYCCLLMYLTLCLAERSLIGCFTSSRWKLSVFFYCPPLSVSLFDPEMTQGDWPWWS